MASVENSVTDGPGLPRAMLLPAEDPFAAMALVPEPSALAMLGFGVLAVGLFVWLTRRKR